MNLITQPSSTSSYRVSTDRPFPPRLLNHLANERTYLSYLRTSATVSALGLLIVKFGLVYGHSNYLLAGGLSITLGVLCVIYGTVRYKRINSKLSASYYIVGSNALEYGVWTLIVLCALGIVLALI